MDFLTEHNLLGLVIGIATFLIIGFFHPVVVKAEYYWGTRCWWIFLLLGLGGIAGSLATDNVLVSTLAGVFAFSSFWTIKELFEQEERVRKGWFPANPKRKKQNSADRQKKHASQKKHRKPQQKQITVRNGRALQMYGDPVRPEMSEQEHRLTGKSNKERTSKKTPKENTSLEQGEKTSHPLKKNPQEAQTKASRQTPRPEKPQESPLLSQGTSSEKPQRSPQKKSKKKPREQTQAISAETPQRNSIDSSVTQEASQETMKRQEAPKRKPNNRQRRPQRAKSNDSNAAKDNSADAMRNPDAEGKIAQEN